MTGEEANPWQPNINNYLPLPNFVERPKPQNHLPSNLISFISEIEELRKSAYSV